MQATKIERRRRLGIPAPIKKAFGAVWGAIKGDVNNFKTCMISAAKGAAMSMIQKVVPVNIGMFTKMLGIRRRLFSFAKMLKKGACAAFGKKALGMCKSGVVAATKKAAGFIKSKLSMLDTTKGEGCVKTLGNALCDKAYKKACGRRLGIPAPIKKAFSAVWG